LKSAGADLLTAGAEMAPDFIVDLSPLAADWTPERLLPLFERLRDALAGGVQSLLIATTSANSGGIAGMTRVFAKEWPGRSVRSVILDGIAKDAACAECIYAELVAPSGPPVATYSETGRTESTAILTSMPGDTEQHLSLDREAVVLITGGARGITAPIALELAERFGCRIELIGRTPEPVEPEDPDLATAHDLPSLRRAVIARGDLKEPAAIEALCARVVAAREVGRNLEAMRATGAAVCYHACDVRDRVTLAAVVEDLYARHGRIDLVVHAAGVIEDKLATDKTPESFCRVFETKANGAEALLSTLRDDVQTIVFFSSVAGAFGNRGQVDYATANDYLDTLAREHNVARSGRVVSIAWGPWGGEGMVSPELQWEYATRGIELIEPEGGIRAFMAEVLAGPRDDAHVLLMRAFPSSLA
jgi:NAD(P)-dependent dehydrogenase (short-subunit alcohol dehydrogenase family)